MPDNETYKVLNLAFSVVRRELQKALNAHAKDGFHPMFVSQNLKDNELIVILGKKA